MEHRASTRFLHRTLFLATHLISVQVFFTPLASSSTVLRHVFFGLPLLRFPWGFHSRACLVISIGFCSVWTSHLHLCFLICKSILGCFLPLITESISTWFFTSHLWKQLFTNVSTRHAGYWALENYHKANAFYKYQEKQYHKTHILGFCVNGDNVTNCW